MSDNALLRACQDMLYLAEGLLPDFTECDAECGEPLCGRDECNEVGCVFDKICALKSAIAAATGGQAQ